MNKKIIILDRDGVINQDSDGYIKSPEEWIPIPGSLEAIAELNRAGYQVVVITNQSGIGRGYYSEEMLQKIHAKMEKALEQVGGKIEKIYYCPHAPEENCNCRKPKTALFEQVAHDFDVDLKDVFFVGDKFQDFQAAKNAGCKFILVQTGYGVEAIKRLAHERTARIAKNLTDAIRQII